MAAKEIVPGLYSIKAGPANVFLIDSGDAGLTLIDSGYPKNASDIKAGIRSIGREPTDLTEIVITHAHPDHLGSAAHLSAGTVPISMPAEEAWIARAGIVSQTMSPTPGLLNRVVFRFLIGDKPYEFPRFEPTGTLLGGETLDLGGGIEVVHTPGHSAGHMSLLWNVDRKVLFAGDAAVNVMGLGLAPGYEDLETGRESLTKLAALEFEVAVFGHGRPILSNASARFVSKFG